MSITTTGLRKTVVAEAVQRAIGECVFLLVYEYYDLFDHTVWAVLTKDEHRPEDSQLICTINHEGHVVWTSDEHNHVPTTLPSSITLPLEAVQFNNVTITIPATDPIIAYHRLCQVLATFEYTTDTFQPLGPAEALSEPQSTTLLSLTH